MSTDIDIIESFLDALWSERGLSNNTLAAYGRDLKTLSVWLVTKNSSLLLANNSQLLDYIAQRINKGSKTTSVARVISSLRRFYRYQLREKIIDEDPTALIELPKLGKPLPTTLSEIEIDLLLESPLVEDALGLRDRAMLELIYATGLRVSELVSLRYNQLSLQQGVVRVIGKGNKERLVPMGDEAVIWLTKYLEESRVELMAGKGVSDHLFVTRRGSGMTRQAFWYLTDTLSNLE